jgi:hypothetical protein
MWLIVAIVGLQLAVWALPRLVVPVAILAVILVIVRLVWWHTRDW